MEIEKKYLVSAVSDLPFDYRQCPCLRIQQAYLSTEPVIRIRQQNSQYYLTYKSAGLMAREEYNLPLTAESYRHLLTKADGHIITKKRYQIPLKHIGLTAELDLFEGIFQGLVLVEVEFLNKAQALSFHPPCWFGSEVTFSGHYHNNTLSKLTFPPDPQLYPFVKAE